MATKYAAQARYEAAHTTKITLKLHNVNDADIISALNNGTGKQTEAKRLIRKGIETERKQD